MRNQFQQLAPQGLIRIAGRGLLALAFALSVVVSAGAAQPGQQSQNQQGSPVNKTKQSETATIGMVVIVYDNDPLAETEAAEPE